MRLWKLTPIDVRDRNWAASAYKSEVIVRAETERAARRLAAHSFGVAANVVPGEEIPFVPWENRRLALCERAQPTDSYAEAGESGVVYPAAAVELAADD